MWGFYATARRAVPSNRLFATCEHPLLPFLGWPVALSPVSPLADGPRAAAGEIAVRVGQASGTVHVVVDVNGYFE